MPWFSKWYCAHWLCESLRAACVLASSDARALTSRSAKWSSPAYRFLVVRFSAAATAMNSIIAVTSASKPVTSAFHVVLRIAKAGRHLASSSRIGRSSMSSVIMTLPS